MSYANTRITTTDGEHYSCVEYPDAVVELRAAALRDDTLMKLESPRIPAGQSYYLAPSAIISILPHR